jgi:hypothetical protein
MRWFGGPAPGDLQRDESVAGASRRGRIVLDLNSPEFLDVFLRLESAELAQVARALDRIRRLDWSTVYQAAGVNWEAIRHIATPTGATAYSLRLSRRVRAIAYRDGEYLRLVSLHPDHDSAYS